MRDQVVGANQTVRNQVVGLANQTVGLNESVVKSLPLPASGSRIHYFAGTVIQGAKTPRGFGVRVTANGTRSFVMRYRIAHHEHLYVIGQHPDWSVLDAVKEARVLRQRIDRGEDPLAGRRKQEAEARETLQAICEEYLSRDGKKLRTVEWQERALERLVYPDLGNRVIRAIKRTDIVRLLDKIEDENGPVMADRTLATVRKIMNWHASRSDDFRSPIVRGMARSKPRERSRERTLADDEVSLVWKTAETSQTPFGAFVQFCLLTGARRGEAAEMSWQELDGSTWTLPAARNKTKVDLVRPLSKQARMVLPARAGDFVFSTDGGKTPISGFSQLKRAFDKACGVKNWTIHDVRRTARTLLSRAGVSPDIAERCLGHVIGGVRGVYDRWEFRDEKAAAYESLAGLISHIINPQDNVTVMDGRRSRRGRVS
jgi:integrase